MFPLRETVTSEHSYIHILSHCQHALSHYHAYIILSSALFRTTQVAKQHFQEKALRYTTTTISENGMPFSELAFVRSRCGELLTKVKENIIVTNHEHKTLHR